MSESFIDRLSLQLSAPRDGAMTRSFTDAAASGFIGEHPPHWSIEAFIPAQTGPLIDYLVGHPDLTEEMRERFSAEADRIVSILRAKANSYHARFAKLYGPVDPDNDSRIPGTTDQIEPPDDSARQSRMCPDDAPPQPPDLTEILELAQQFLTDAGYQKLRREDIERCVGVASTWGVPLHVDFDLFERLEVYARGDVVGTRMRRRLRNLYRPEPVSVQLYQRMVILFQLKRDDDSQEQLSASSLHLRMFKNIPQQDIDMLLPAARVRITKIDHAKIIVPSLGGILWSLRKIAQFALIFAALTFYSTAVLIGLIAATIGYVVKTVMGYFQTKNRYLLNLTRNLYFQKLDTNSGAAFRAIEQAHRQVVNETIIAYFAIRTSDEPLGTRRLRRRCERILREAIGVEVDFRADAALQRLADMGYVTPTEDDKWRNLPVVDLAKDTS